MNWIALNSINQLDEIRSNAEQVCLIFKHSIRCPVSSMAKRTIEYAATRIPPGIPVYYLDLINYRDISNAVAEWWQVKHESPQLLLVKGATCIFHASHGDIDIDELLTQLS